jgi:hypothetical protein
MTTEQLIDALLVAGLDDWLHLADVAWAAREFANGGETEDVVAVASEALAALVDQGLVEVGDVSDGGFFEWDATPEEAILRIQREWRALRREPQPGDVCWVANTTLGDQRAREIMEGRER